MDKDDYKPKRHISFEDAIRKAATTRMNPTILIEELDKKYTIPNAENSLVTFLNLTVKDGIADRFIIMVWLTLDSNKSVPPYELIPHIDRTKNKGKDTGKFFIPIRDIRPLKPEGVPETQNPVRINKGDTIEVSIIKNSAYPNEKFEAAILTYELLSH